MTVIGLPPGIRAYGNEALVYLIRGEGGGLYWLAPPEGTPRMITNYITVTDLEESAKRVPELGGRVVTDRMEVPGMGWFRIVSDPEGNSIGLWQTARPAPPPPAAKTKKPAKKSPPKKKKKKPAKKRKR